MPGYSRHNGWAVSRPVPITRQTGHVIP